MIKLKSEVNKSQIMRELKAEAKAMYDNAYEGEYAIEQFLLGAESLFKKLSIGVVVRRSEQLVCDKCGYPMFYHKPDDIMYCHGCDNTKPAN